MQKLDHLRSVLEDARDSVAEALDTSRRLESGSLPPDRLNRFVALAEDGGHLLSQVACGLNQSGCNATKRIEFQ